MKISSKIKNIYKDTSAAFVTNVLEELNADLFIYTPNKAGVSYVTALNNKSIVANEDQSSKKNASRSVKFGNMMKVYFAIATFK